MKRVIALVAGLLLFAAACTSSSDEGDQGDDLSNADPGDCIVVDMASSPEKIALMTELAKEFNGSTRRKVGNTCVFVRPARQGVRRGAALLAAGWPDPEANGPQPVIWSPAASTWGAVAQPATARRGRGRRSPTPAKPFMLTPLVIAMPKPMAEALGYPATPLGFSDILAPRARTRRGGPRTAIPSGVRSGSARPTRTSRRAGCTSRSRSTTPRPARRRTSPSRTSPAPTCRRSSRASSRPSSTTATPRSRSSTTGTGPTRAGTALDLRVGGRRRGEVGDRLQHRQPRRHPRSGRGAAARRGSRSSRSTRRRARSTPTTRSSSSTRRG